MRVQRVERQLCAGHHVLNYASCRWRGPAGMIKPHKLGPMLDAANLSGVVPLVAMLLATKARAADLAADLALRTAESEYVTLVPGIFRLAK